MMKKTSAPHTDVDLGEVQKKLEEALESVRPIIELLVTARRHVLFRPRTYGHSLAARMGALAVAGKRF